MRNTHYIVWSEHETEWVCYFHVRYGQGRAARRRLTATVAFAKPLGHASTPDLLRALAQAYDTKFGHLHQ